MGEKQENTLDKVGVGRVNYFAVSETKEKFFQFRWNVSGFRKILGQPDKIYDSPTFKQKEGGKIYEWKLRIDVDSENKTTLSNDAEECQYLPVYLLFICGPLPAAVKFSIGILDSKETPRTIATTEHAFTQPNTDFGWATFQSVPALLDSANDLLHDDTLKLYCKIWIALEVEHKMMEGRTANRATKKVKRDDDFFCDVHNMLMSSIFTDVSIQTKNNKKLKAHKAILASRSSVFMAMFQNEMFESINNIVKIVDFDEAVVIGMLNYIYSNFIAHEMLEERATEFLQIAEKYDIKGLKEVAEETIIDNISVENAADCLVLADTHNALDLKAKSIQFININKEEVVKTEGFKKLASTNKLLIVDLYMQKKVVQ